MQARQNSITAGRGLEKYRCQDGHDFVPIEAAAEVVHRQATVSAPIVGDAEVCAVGNHGRLKLFQMG
jgi:hypothetical protein